MRACPNCGYRCNDNDSKCPNCGFTFSNTTTNSSTSTKKAIPGRVWSVGTSQFWATMITIILVIAGFRILYNITGITIVDIGYIIADTVSDYYSSL